MKDNCKRTLTPKLRFPEFRDRPYRRVKLGDVAEEATERNKKSLDADAVMGVFKGQGMLPMEQRLVAKDLSRYKIVKKEYFAYNPMRLNIGSIARWAGDEHVLVSPDYVVFRCSDDSDHNLDPNYLDQFRGSDQWDRFVTMSGDGSVRVRIYFRDLATLQLILPTLPEQQKIAECLSSLDGLIAAEYRTLEALKAHKKGLMQQVFPQPGQNQPRLRFPEFRDNGDWVEAKLGQLGKLVSGLTYSPKDVRDNGLLVLRSSNIQNGEIALDDCVYVTPTVKGANLAKPDDILICVRNGSKPLIGKNAMIPEGIPKCTHGAFMTILRAHAACFVFQLLQTSAFQKQVAADLGATINSINNSNLRRYRFFVPAEPLEQKRIAECLSALDTQIAAQAAKIDALKAHKRGLMQQLFPAPEEQ